MVDLTGPWGSIPVGGTAGVTFREALFGYAVSAVPYAKAELYLDTDFPAVDKTGANRFENVALAHARLVRILVDDVLAEEAATD